MKQLKPVSAILILILFTGVCLGDTIPEPGRLYFGFRNISFVRDDEYSNPVIEGYTLIGFFIQPELVYMPSQKITLRLGAHMLSYSGTNKYSLVKPVFSTTYNFARGFTLIAGTLSGSDSHRMEDPHFNKERLYNEYSEDGLQLRFLNDHIFSDSWLSWEHFIFKNDTTREVFTAGESFSWNSGMINDFLKVETPVQVQFKHYGGQISNYSGDVLTYLNTAAGIRITALPAGMKETGIGISGFLFNGKCLSGNPSSGIRSGYGEWYRLFVDYRIVHLEGGYWRSRNFYAPNGNFIFSSVSDHLPGVVIHDRRIITCSAGISAFPDRVVKFFLGFDGYYDTDLKKFDTAFTLHLRFDKLFRLADLK